MVWFKKCLVVNSNNWFDIVGIRNCDVDSSYWIELGRPVWAVPLECRQWWCY